MMPAVLALSVLMRAGPSSADPLTAAQFDQLALRCGFSVAPLTLAAIARTESRFEPFAINDNTTGVVGVPTTSAIAVQVATRLLEAGHSLDLGIMQINSGNFRKLGMTPESAFDPCRSIAAAATILTGDYAGGETHPAQQAALRGALSKYNTGDVVAGFDNGYVHKVELAAREVVPAIDVDMASTSSSPQPLPSPRQPPSTERTTLPAPAPADPDAPPAWNVWASFDYGASDHLGPQDHEPDGSEAGMAVLADAQAGSTASPTRSTRSARGAP